MKKEGSAAIYLVGAAALLLLALIMWYFWPAPSSLDCSYDRQCFLTAADRCNQAILFQNNAGTIRYAIEGCTLTKSIEAFAPDEVDEVKVLFQGKSMSCAFEKGAFDEQLLDGIAGGMQHCEGDLKDVIIALRTAQVS